MFRPVKDGLCPNEALVKYPLGKYLGLKILADKTFGTEQSSMLAFLTWPS